MTNILMCGHCGQRNQKDNRFCTQCGSALSESAVIMDEIEYAKRHPHNNDEPEIHEYKSYPFLKFIAEVFKFSGWLLVIAGIVLFPIFITGIGLGSPTKSDTFIEVIAGLISISQVAIAFIFSLYSIFTGLFLIATGESIDLFIDLQENADRQSILLSLLYYREKEKKNDLARAMNR